MTTATDWGTGIRTGTGTGGGGIGVTTSGAGAGTMTGVTVAGREFGAAATTVGVTDAGLASLPDLPNASAGKKNPAGGPAAKTGCGDVVFGWALPQP
jgi:hypothetical protein